VALDGPFLDEHIFLGEVIGGLRSGQTVGEPAIG
jgi:hypothetical protein